MDRNFSIASTIDILSGSQLYDLHNDFDFMGINFEVSSSYLTLLWANNREELRICFQLVKFLRMKGFDEAMPRQEDSRLSFMGYLHPDDVDLMDGFLTEDLASENHHLIFCFEGGLSMKVFAASAEFLPMQRTP